MNEELRAIKRAKTWDLVTLPTRKNSIVVKWIYKTKLKPDGSIAKHKDRLLAKGFTQKEGEDNTEIFAHVARFETVRTLVSLASWKGRKILPLDVKTAFLNGPPDEEVYIQKPPGFEVTAAPHSNEGQN